MIKVIIIDDESLARRLLREYLMQEKGIEIVAECENGFEGIKSIHEHRPDLIFLDIQMPKLTGFEMLEVLDYTPHVIFTTAFDEYAIHAFDKNAVDYLLKPIRQDRFQKSLNKFKHLHNQSSSANKPPQIAEDLVQTLERVVVKVGTQIKIIPVHKIYYLEAYDDYVKIHTEEGMFLKNKTMKSFENQLDPKKFVRVHRSFIIKIEQLMKIENYEKETYIATLINGAKVNISKSGYSRLKNVIGM